MSSGLYLSGFNPTLGFIYTNNKYTTAVKIIPTIIMVCLILKLSNWYGFQAGNAPLLIGVYVIGSIQLFFIGLIGEYISLKKEKQSLPAPSL